MAWVDVEVSEEQRKEMSGGGGNWVKFSAIGDKVWGRFDAYEERDSRLNPGKKDHNYTLTGPDGTVSFTAPTDLHVKLQKAMRPPDGTSKGGLGLKPGVGHRICVTYTSNLDTGQASPMKVFRLQVDTAPAAQGQAQTQQRQPAAQARAMPVRDQDILGPADPPGAQRRQAARPSGAAGYDDIPF